MTRFRSVLVGVCVGMIALATGAPVVCAQGTPQIVGEPIPHEKALGTPVYRDCGLRKEAVDAFVNHQSPQRRSKRANTTIEVSYGDNFPDAAQAAFDRAADIWERHIFSSVTIRVQASYEALGDGVLAAAGPNNFYGIDATGDGEADAIVGDALAGALLDEAPQSQAPDIIVNVNAERNDWHFGRSPAPSGTIDFTTVALHEIGHGLNYLDFFFVERGQREYPTATVEGNRYQIERRQGRGGRYQQVATIPQEGDAEKTQRKQYTAAHQTPGQYAYRVTARDGTGNAVASASREVRVDFEGDVYALGPYPNPVRETASFDLTARQSQSVTVEVYDALGKRVYTDRREVRAQDPTFLSIDVSQWASGVYFLRLRGRTSIGQTEKMVVVK